MHITILYILVFITGGASIAFLILWIISRGQNKKRIGELKDRLSTIKMNHKQETEALRADIRRHAYIIEEYKQKIAAINTGAQATQNSEKENNASSYQESTEAQAISKERENLKAEKEQFKLKNKKLWEQSIAIHKEKERIDTLRKDVEARHQEVQESIKYAKRIQQAIIPDNKFLEKILPEHFILWQPRDIVSGDFYWAKQMGQYLVIVAADCTGHGVPGAFMSMLGIAFLNEIVSESDEPKSSEILEELRKLVKSSLKQTGNRDEPKDGMDMALCVLDKTNQKLYFSGAKNPLYIIRNNELTEIKPTPNPIGIHLKEKPFQQNEIQLQTGDTFYMFTDGYIDQFGGEKGHKFMSKNFKKLLKQINESTSSMSRQKEHLKETFDTWKGEKYKQLDDVLVMGFKV